MHALWETIRSIGIADVLDMAVVSVFIYAILRLFEWTKAAAIARGMLILGALYIFARHMGMVLTTWIFHGFFAVFIIAVVIIFQEELRRFFERLAVWSARPQLQPFQSNTTDTLVRCLSQCAHERTGALIVLRGKDLLDRHMEGGDELDGKLSAALLMSVFDVHSDGHDGAVLIDGGRLRKFGLHLPLSKNLVALAGLGTRHAAALGLSEISDALCVVVSEQRGTISVAHRGSLRLVNDPGELERIVAEFLRVEGGRPAGWWRRLFTHNKTEKLFAGALSFVLWLMFVQGFKPETRTYVVSLVPRNTPEGLVLKTFSPHDIKLTLSGLEREMTSLDPTRMHVHLNLDGQEPGADRIVISEDDMHLPSTVRFVQSEPPAVAVQLVAAPPSAPAPSLPK